MDLTAKHTHPLLADINNLRTIRQQLSQSMLDVGIDNDIDEIIQLVEIYLVSQIAKGDKFS